jgi:hypothetical protein
MITAMVALAGVAVVIAVRLLAIVVRVLGLVAQPLALALGTLGDASREKTRELWTFTVTHPDRSMVGQQRLAERAEAGDIVAMDGRDHPGHRETAAEAPTSATPLPAGVVP